jgi:hypothetical protein
MASYGLTTDLVSAAQTQPSDDPLARPLVLRSINAARRAQIAASRAYIAVYRCIAEMVRVSDDRRFLDVSVNPPTTISREAPTNLNELRSISQASMVTLREVEQYLENLQRVLNPKLPPTPAMPIGVPYWADDVRRDAVLKLEHKDEPKELVLYFEQVVFRIEQLAQIAEVYEEQAITLADLTEQGRMDPERRR